LIILRFPICHPEFPIFYSDSPIFGPEFPRFVILSEAKDLGNFAGSRTTIRAER